MSFPQHFFELNPKSQIWQRVFENTQKVGKTVRNQKFRGPVLYM